MELYDALRASRFRIAGMYDSQARKKLILCFSDDSNFICGGWSPAPMLHFYRYKFESRTLKPLETHTQLKYMNSLYWKPVAPYEMEKTNEFRE